MKIQEINVTTGETTMRDMTPEEILEHQQMAEIEATGNQKQKNRRDKYAKKEKLLDAWLEASVNYFEAIKSGTPPPNFANFIRSVYQAYIADDDVS